MCKWHLIVVLFYVSLISNDIEHFYVLIIHHYVFSCEESIQIFHPFLYFWFFVLLVLRVFCFFLKYSLPASSLSDIYFLNIFSQSLLCLFIFLMLSSESKHFKFWWSLTFVVVVLCFVLFMYYLQNLTLGKSCKLHKPQFLLL